MSIIDDTINTTDGKIISTGKLDKYSSEKKSDLISNFSKSIENTDNQKFIDRYKREQYISGLVNTDSFYDEGDTILTTKYFNSKVFKINGDNISEMGEEYRNIRKIGNFYVGINIKIDGNNRKIDGSEVYTLLDNTGQKIRELRGYPYFREDENIITEIYKDDGVDKNTIYDSEFSILVDGVSRTEMHSYINALNEDKNLSLRKERIDNEERLNNLVVNYDFKFEGDTIFINEIKNKEGDIIFSSEGGRYKINTPFDLSIEIVDHNRKKDDINNGLFLISGESKTGEVSDIFINAKNNVRLDFNDYVGYTFLKGNIIKHFISSNNSELYNAKTGEKLGKSGLDLDNEHHFKFITLDNGKNQLVENKTGNVKEQEFDKYIKQYDDGNKKIVIVENNGEIQTIEIQK